jgi:hypothetical protein
VNTTIEVTKKITTLINVLTVEAEDQQKLIRLLPDNAESVVSRLDGWISTSFIAATDQRHVLIYSQRRDLASVDAVQTNPDMVAYFPEDRRAHRVRQPRWRRRLQLPRLMPG